MTETAKPGYAYVLKIALFVCALFLAQITEALAVPEAPRDLSKSDYDYMTDYVLKGDWPRCRTALSASAQATGDTKLAKPWKACYDDLVKRKAETRAIQIAGVSVQTYCYVRYLKHDDSQTEHLNACQRYY